MTLALIGVNHKTAPIELRERIAISRDELPETTRALGEMPGVNECMIVSTCNRVEILASRRNAGTDLIEFLHQRFGIDPAELAPHIYEHRDQEAVRHLFRMAASLDSMVVGEPQILGQVKEAFAVAKSSGTIAGQLEHLLQSAFAAAKKARSETGIGSNSVSIASVAVDMARKIFGSLQGRTVFLVGAGKMSELAARHLVQQGAGTVLVTNRTYERARRMAEEFEGCDAAGGSVRRAVRSGQQRRHRHQLHRRAASHLPPRTWAGIPAAPPQPAHVLYRYCRSARRGSGDEQAGRHLRLRH